MTPGRTLIMRAPGCQRPVKFATINSGNTFGAIFWTDGKREAPMLPDQPWLRKSPSEGVLFWSDECEEIASVDAFSGEGEAEWEDLEFAVEPSEDEYFHAVTSEMPGGDPEKETHIRRRLWWAGNDPFRREEGGRLTERHLENIRALLTLLSGDDPTDLLTRAEIHRELGERTEAIAILDGEIPVDYQGAATRIKELAESGETVVAQFV